MDLKNELAQAFEKYKNQEFIEDDSKLLDLFDQLDPISCDEIYSRWATGPFNTDHWATKAVSKVKWYGQWFRSKMDATPLVCFDEEGNLFPYQVIGGEGTLWMAEFRGKISATMMCDLQPVFNYFRKVDDNTLMGIMSEKKLLPETDAEPTDRYFYFHSRRIAEFPVDFVIKNEMDLWPASQQAPKPASPQVRQRAERKSC
ncbi:DUF4334 domain-containing protein [Terriglobus saanensis]|uniref:Uncharacterized protein n=1 Tax=Terriglobus saanensis (strain ATCC BAA-1853 / DSM 23119 / SP1PR4) TaxID=401053 RepID=E8V5V5_TERSS|nr:DUF4334 domain-containing protein [Terriglobus saanensis]ADV83773.1 hypothetical protein AciPR4_3014 [Terriglobus saanensis SP1PR4]